MQTPNTKAGEITETIMAKVRSKLPDLTTHSYNRIYESILEEMQIKFPEPKVEAPRRFAGFFG